MTKRAAESFKWNSATTQLLVHAGLSRTESRAGCLSEVLCSFEQQGCREIDVDLLVGAVNDILKCIHELNRLGYADRLSVAPDNRMVSESIVYAVAEIMRQLTSALSDMLPLEDSGRARTVISEALDQIAIAWSAFMAGDIEDVIAEVRISNGFRPRTVDWAMDDGKTT